MSHTKEGQLAKSGAITYADAVQRVFRRREAFATAQPHSVLIVGYGTTYVYQGGVLCYIQDQHIRVLRVHDGAQEESVIHLPTLLEYTVVGNTADRHGQLTLLNYSERVLTFLYEPDNDDQVAWLVALDVRPGPATRKRIRAAIRLETTEKLFVRHNKDYLYYGTHSGIASHGHHEWVIRGIKLPNRPPSTKDHVLQLSDLVGSDIGSTVAFEIHNGYFYALSNQTSFDVEEVDWTSYYHCLRFPLDKPRKDCIEANTEIWRRQHIEGPINDSWTDLGMRTDERSGKLLIVECRREWHGGGSKSMRTFYTQKIDLRLSHESDTLTCARPTSVNGTAPTSRFPVSRPLPTNDPLASTIDENSKPHWAPPSTRLPRNWHPEEDPVSKPCQIFTLAKTKYRTYIPCSSSFLDVVLDNITPIPATLIRRPPQRVRIRIGSRKRASPFNEDGTLRKRERSEENGRVIEGSEEAFVDRGIRLWPPDNAPPQLLNILNHCTDMSEVEASSDERSIVYMAGSSSSPGGKAIVLINFDPAILFPDLPFLGSASSPSQHPHGHESSCSVTLEPRRFEACKGKLASHTVDVIGADSGTTAQWFRTERAMYRDIGLGFRLR